MNDISPEKMPLSDLAKCSLKLYQKIDSFVNESYFLYDKSNLMKQTSVTEINKLLSIYDSTGYFDKKRYKQDRANNFVS